MTFEELDFKAHPAKMGGIHACNTLKNGWGVSVIQGDMFYTSGSEEYELAVLGKDGELHYDNPVADGDVRGHLKKDELMELINQVEGYE